MYALALLALPALAHSPTPCDEVLSAHGYAVAAGLDTTTLDALAGRLCGGGAPAGASPICREARVLQRLGALGGMDDGAASAVARMADVSCASGVSDPSQPLMWRSGMVARSPDGAWRWPNGVSARAVDGRLNYPNGIVARAADGRWTYPNAVTARTADGAWSRPNAVRVGGAEALLMWVCEQTGERCVADIEPLRYLEGDEHTVAVLQLAWAAR